MYAREQGVTLTKGQLEAIFPRGWKSHPVRDSGSEAVRLAHMKDGTWWAEWRGEAVFWASRWWKIPNVVGSRAQAIDQFVKDRV